MAFSDTLPRLGISGIGGRPPRSVQVVAVVDPHLDADVALGGLGLGEAVLDLAPAASTAGCCPPSPFSQRAISAPPSRPDSCMLDALGARSPSSCRWPASSCGGSSARFSSCSAMSSATSCGSISGRLTSIVLTSMCRWRQVLEVLGQLVDLPALLADDHADAGRVDEDRHLLARPLDADLGDAGAAVALLDELADLRGPRPAVPRSPACWRTSALPVDHDAGAEAGRSNFLTH